MKTAINLLPVTSQKQLMLHRRLTQWCIAVCVVVVMIWVARGYKLRECRVFEQQREVMAREQRPIDAMNREIADMRQQLQDLDQQERVALELDHQRRVLTLLGTISQSAQKSEGKLRVLNLQVVDLQYSGAASKQPGSSVQAGSFSLTGEALDSPTVAELLDKLQHSGLFTSVELVSLKERQEGEVALHDFQVLCGL
jgi:Tfp pilus assembly protein PilN